MTKPVATPQFTHPRCRPHPAKNYFRAEYSMIRYGKRKLQKDQEGTGTMMLMMKDLQHHFAAALNQEIDCLITF